MNKLALHSKVQLKVKRVTIAINEYRKLAGKKIKGENQGGEENQRPFNYIQAWSPVQPIWLKFGKTNTAHLVVSLADSMEGYMLLQRQEVLQMAF